MFNCSKCWENPCICGNEYQTWPKEKIEKQIIMLQSVLKKRDEGEIRYLNVEDENDRR